MKMYVIKNKDSNVYYQKTLFGLQKHFVCDINDATKMSFERANKTLQKFNYPKNYKIIEVNKNGKNKKATRNI